MKLDEKPDKLRVSGVAPLAGAWIETSFGSESGMERKGRPPRGGVD